MREIDRLASAARRRQRCSLALAYAALCIGVLVFALPIWMTLVGSTHDAGSLGRGEAPLWFGPHGPGNYALALTAGGTGTRSAVAVPASAMLLNSALMALLIAAGKIVVSVLSAYAVVFFAFPGRKIAFWLIFSTLMLPVEIRIIPTFAVMVNLDLTNSMAGLTVPLMASATATLLFRQFFLAIPDEYVEAAKMDGAGPLRFFRDVALPLSMPNIAALFVILFIHGWNQYLWPLLMVNDRTLETIVVGLARMIGSGDSHNEWNTIMATAMMALLPPVLVVLLLQRWFINGLTEAER